MSGDALLEFQDLIPEVIQKCHTNTDTILNAYGATDILDPGLFEAHVEHQGHL